MSNLTAGVDPAKFVNSPIAPEDTSKSSANSERTEVRPAEQNGVPIGQGVFATIDVKKGADVLVVDNPLIALVEEAQLQNICSGCYDTSKAGSIDNRRPDLVKACTRCKVVYYCDKNCQRKDWKAGHSLECKTYAELYPKILPLPVRAVLRILMLRRADKIIPEVYSESLALTYPKIYDCVESQETKDHLLMAKALREYSNLTDLDNKWVASLFGRLNANSFCLTSAFGRRRGVYFHPGPARFNHSCDPNASYSFAKGKCYIRAIRPIAKDEQIFISYVDTTYSVGTRRHELQERYRFECQCPKCLHEAATIEPEDLIKRSEHERETNAKIDEILKANSASGFTSAWKLSSMIRILSEKADWDAVNTQQQPLAAIRSEIMASKAKDQLYKMSAVDAAIRHSRTDPAQYPDECHPMRREHALEFVWHLMYANEYMRPELMRSSNDDYDHLFNIHEISPLFYAYMVVHWILTGDITCRTSVQDAKKKMEGVVWPNPLMKSDAERHIPWMTEDLEEAGMLGRNRDKNVQEHLKKMEAIVVATLEQEKRNMW
ncbi:SET and MYND domain protein, putative [Talaromyces stipitatus ATCC 10500]|uniref:SET and MYND domain protein, putative n=1 Tax=Talaromyces stipitatus (strain ATCC 10500 / CBS 375.48 / QM 6759 / NRRL 1006) TaxID=441959 RepID=B8MDV9_TALSN|nr:SET and MYND domain protein, putative [Talaromyces stipitatus ATCC 10500]EED16036.1 SET and MYND domain protein, putative [Talaromyces stipitatus ATCC 10500]